MELSPADCGGLCGKKMACVSNPITTGGVVAMDEYMVSPLQPHLEDTGSIVFSAEGLRTTARLVVKGGYIKLILKTQYSLYFQVRGS